MVSKRTSLPLAAVAALALAISGCAHDGDGPGPDSPSLGGDGPITWGPRLAGSDLSAVRGAEDEFGAEIVDALGAAARAAPAAAVNGVSQSSLIGHAVGGMRVHVVRDDDGDLVYELTDGSQVVVRVPSSVPRQGFSLAVFTNLLPGIEPDLSSFPHEVMGVWAWNGAAGSFWSPSPSIPAAPFGAMPASGTATYKGDAAGLHAEGDGVEKFVADATLVADFDSLTVDGRIDEFRTLSGETLGDLSVTLGEAEFSRNEDVFSGSTSSDGTVDGGNWGARWSGGEGGAMGGTFGFAADDGSVSVLGAFTASTGGSGSGGDPDDPVATDR